jgi:hypothetical protein
MAVVGAMTLSGSVLALDEMEQNHPISSAQVLSESEVRSGMTITGEISAILTPDNKNTPDLDFFSFQARAGDILSFSIDSKSSANGFFIPHLTVLSGASPYDKLREQMGSLAVNPRIENFLVKTDGTYVIAVTSGGCTLALVFATCRSMIVSSASLGRYSMSITPAVPPALQVEINIRPGSGETAPINPKSRGNIPVAIISSQRDKFDALQIEVDAKSLKFGATGEQMSLRRCDTKGVDVNGDGVLDMVCHFETEKTEFTEASVEGKLTGKVTGGGAIEGHGRLKINMPKIDGQ